jgi:hypothetical protein
LPFFRPPKVKEENFGAANKRLVWKGVVSKTIDPGAKPHKRQKTSGSH